MQSRPGAGQRCPSDAAETFDTSGKQPRNAILARMIAAWQTCANDLVKCDSPTAEPRLQFEGIKTAAAFIRYDIVGWPHVLGRAT